MLEEPGSEQNLYTQISGLGQVSGSGRIQTSSKSLDLGRISILKFSGPRQALVLGRIQKARKSRAQVRLLVDSVYRKLEKLGFRQNQYTQKFRARQALVLGRIQNARKTRPGQNQYTQIFRVRAGSCSLAYTESSKSQGPGQNLYTQKFRAQAGSCSLAYTNKLEKPGFEQDLYTQIFRAQAGSCSGAYTEARKFRAQAGS